MKKSSPSDIAKMDSLKIPKGVTTSKPSGSVPITVRFNAGEESLDDIFQSFHNNSAVGGGGGGDSLSSSPQQQNPDEVNTRNNFLQGNFFNRKRSGSIEGTSPSSMGPNLVAALALSTSETNSVGTWKLIKGKVSQTIEDIKSSKSSNQSVTFKGDNGNDPDSDQDNATMQSSVSDELSLDQEFRLLNKCDSDSDIEPDILLEGDVERSRLRRSLAHLKSKVKSKAQSSSTSSSAAKGGLHSTNQLSMPAMSTTSLSTTAPSSSGGRNNKKDTSPSHSNTTSSLRSTFLRKRKKQPAETAELVTASVAPTQPPASQSIPGATTTISHVKPEKKKGIIPGKKEVEIESGVEMLEDMIPPATAAAALTANTGKDNKSTNKRLGMDLPIESIALPQRSEINSASIYPNVSSNDGDGGATAVDTTGDVRSSADASQYGSLTLSNSNGPLLQRDYLTTFHEILKKIPYISIVLLIFVMLMPSIPDFLRGIIVCWLTISILDACWIYIERILEKYITLNGPEKSKFQLPDYSKMSICEIPAVEEHKTVKTYSGWMNEINNYDPNNFHISMTKSVYIKLDGSMLRVSNTTARIPKRQMWNEPPIDRKTVSFTRHRSFNLLGCRVEMCPRGLARKRYFNRKYPIQLIVKNSDEQKPEKLTLLPIVTTSPASSATTTTATSTTTSTNKRPSSGSIGKEDGKSSSLVDVKNINAHQSNKDNNSLSAPSASIPHQNSSESLDDRSDKSGGFVDVESDLDFAATILNADVQLLQDCNNQESDMNNCSVPCGDETRLLLFARGDREKEDWYRRFVAASTGAITDQDLHIPNIQMISDFEIQAAINAASFLPDLLAKTKETNVVDSASSIASNSSFADETKTTTAEVDKGEKSPARKSSDSYAKSKTPDIDSNDSHSPTDSPLAVVTAVDPTFEGLLISSCAARNPLEYIKFMARYQRACSQKHIPVLKRTSNITEPTAKRNRREKRLEDELWKGIDQSLYLGPSGSVVWANVLIGRVLFSCLTDTILLSKIQEFLQKKLSSIKLPGFMEDVSITQIYLGDTPPLIHRVSQPMLDERGTWIDADVTYEGLMHMTITTKLNLLRLKRQQTRGGGGVLDMGGPGASGGGGLCGGYSAPMSGSPPIAGSTAPIDIINDELSANQTDQLIDEVLVNCAIYDSNAESTGASSSESESPTVGSLETGNTNESQFFNSSPGNARRLFKIVDRIAASNLFQYATELSYVQRAMENMSTNITLRVELKGLVSRVVINIPPPPSDRIWLSFRGPPRLWITAKPAVGDHTFDWSIVTNVIESKLCEEVNKYLVYPNMVDVTVPFLGQSTYKE